MTPAKKKTTKAAAKKKTEEVAKDDALEEVEEVVEEAVEGATPLPPREGTVGPADYSETMGHNFMVYAKSVLVDRALPSIDGLKPVQRRILLAMNDLRLRPDSRYSKCAKVVGTTLGSYHPHGDASVYGALVNMVQDFTMRVPLVDGHGSFGSIDGDGAAAMRYTEARLGAAAMELLADLDEEILPDHYGRNFDESIAEPALLPARFPNILINGGTGIAVGMATTILPHNPGEVLDLCVWRADNPDASREEVADRLEGPDFPTGATVLRDEGLRASYVHGKGKVTAVAKAHVEELQGNREKIVVTEVPWSVNKGDLLTKIAKQHADGKFPEITELNDLSRGDHDIRIEAVLKWGANSKAVLQRLLSSTGLRRTYGVEMNVLIDGRPETLSLAEIIDHFLLFRRTVVRNRALKRIREIKERLHKLEAYTKVVDKTDEVVQTIKKSKDRASAKPPLKKLLSIDDQQAQWIVEMQLGQLTQLDRTKLLEEVGALEEELAGLEELVGSDKLINEKMITEFKDLRGVWKKEGRLQRQSSLVDPADAEGDPLSMSAPAEECLLLLSRSGRALCGQGTLRRGASLSLDKDDRLAIVAEASTDEEWMIFSDRGKAYRLRLSELPLDSRRVRGVELSSVIGWEEGEKVVGGERIEAKAEGSLLFVSEGGMVRRTARREFSGAHSGGLLAAKLKGEDRLLAVLDCPDGGDIVLLGSHGRMIRFPDDAVRQMGRTAAGVRGMRLPEGEEIVGALVLENDDQAMLLVASGGFAKRVPSPEIPRQGRGGGGVITMKVGGKYGQPVWGSRSEKTDELWIESSPGKLKPYPLGKIAQGKRNTVPKRWPGENSHSVWSLPQDGRGEEESPKSRPSSGKSSKKPSGKSSSK